MKKFLYWIGGFISSLLSIVFFGLLICLVIVKLLGNFTTSDKVKEYLKDLNIMELKIGEVLEGEDVDKEATVKTIISDTLREGALSESEISKIVDNEELMIFINDTLSEYLTYAIFKENKPNIDSNRLITIIENAGYTLTNDEKNDLRNGIQEISDSIEAENIDSLEFTDAVSDFNKYATEEKLIGYIIIIVVVFYGLFALLRWSFYKPLMWMGIPSLLVGILLLLISPLKNTLMQKASGEFVEMKNFFDGILNPIMNQITTMGIITLIIGIVAIGGFITIVVLRNKYNNISEDFNVSPSDIKE